MADEEGFVRRWSRRKSEAREPTRDAGPVPPAAPAASAPPPAPPTGGEDENAGEVVDLAALPAIESLTYESDFTVFLRPGVPAELRRRALRQLWRSDPVLANLDGLVEYGEDYSRIGMVKEVVRTAYQVGRGLLDRIEDAAQPAPADAAGAAGKDEVAAETADDEPAVSQPPPEQPS